MEAVGSPLWQLKWQTDFPQAAPLGSFSDCHNYDRTPAAYCGGLPASVRSQWWAYPTGWPDTATENHMRLGGYYDPAHTISISGGQMHIRMFRGTGPIHSAAVVPKAAIGLIVRKVRGDGSAFPTPGQAPAIRARTCSGRPATRSSTRSISLRASGTAASASTCTAFPRATPPRTSARPARTWASWNTTETEWWPGNLAFYVDGTEVYHLTGKWVPDQPMSWIIQNETALNGEIAPENSSAQLNISYVAVYTYAGKKT